MLDRFLKKFRRPAERQDFVVGAYYSIENKGTYGIAKVLAVDKRGIHVRLYRNSWQTRPIEIDPAKLELGGTINDEGRVGIGHLPLTREHFIAWEPVLLQRGSVQNDELDGFRDWQELEGGYFDIPS